MSHKHIASQAIQCDGKKSFDAFTVAKKHASRGAVPYRCPHCGKFHNGHAMRTGKRPQIVPEVVL